MLKIRFTLYILILSLFISSCAIEIKQAPIGTPTTAQANNDRRRTTSVTKVPVTWADLNLTGRLVYISGGDQVNFFTSTVEMLNLATGDVSTIFQADDNSFIYAVTVSPDGKQLVMSYSLSTAAGRSGNPALYIMPLDGSSAPQLLFPPVSEDDVYFQPLWSPDGKYIYYSHINLAPAKGQQTQNVEIYRMAYPEMTMKKIAESAFWLNISADAKQIVYVSVNQANGADQLVLANSDGKNPQPVMISSNQAANIIDAPLFSPDGQSILFSAVSTFQSSGPTWIEKLFGVTVASAHTVPSDWWSVPVGGGRAKQLTHLQATSLNAAVSPDKKYIISDSSYGLFVMNPDGTDLRMLRRSAGSIPSTVNWIP